MTIRKPGDYVVNDELTEKELQWFVQDCVASGADEHYDVGRNYATMYYISDMMDAVGSEFRKGVEIAGGNNVTLEYKYNKMPKRKPGDYVENSYLTPLEREEFVEDCLESGFEDVRDSKTKCESYFTTAAYPSGNVVANNGFVFNIDFNNVTHEYAKKGTSMNKDKHIEELEQRVAQLEKQCVENTVGNTEPKDESVTEEHVGRLVMFRDLDSQEWDGPCVLNRVVHDDNEPYIVGEDPWKQAKLYKGPTKPNWIEHDGKGVPEEVRQVDKVLAQNRNGNIVLSSSASNCWVYSEGELGNQIVRYTIIEP